MGKREEDGEEGRGGLGGGERRMGRMEEDDVEERRGWGKEGRVSRGWREGGKESGMGRRATE